MRKSWLNLRKKIDSDDTDGVTVYPDIIVHHRGTMENFIVIEAKKTSSGNRDDIEKLRAYKTDLGYHLAYFIMFPVAEAFRHVNEEMIDEYIQEIE